MIYLDYNATTPLGDRVLDEMIPFFTRCFANASSTDHSPGMEARSAVEKAREMVAALIGAMPEEIIFTSGATEANNIAVLGTMARAPSDAELIVSAVEHPAVLEAAQTFGDRARFIPVGGDGLVDVADVERAITEKTALVSIMTVNNETGAVQPIDEVGHVCADASVPLHTDAVQAGARMPIDVRRSQVALLSLSAHKLYGPKGVGALFVRRRRPRAKVAPITFGGGHERNLRPGTLNVPGIVGFGAAAELVAAVGTRDWAREHGMRERLLTELHADLPVDVKLNSPALACLPQTLNVRFVGVSAAGLLHSLSDRVAIASGSACSTTSVEPSHVLLAQGLSREEAAESIRISFGRQTSPKELGRFVELVGSAITELMRFDASSKRVTA